MPYIDKIKEFAVIVEQGSGCLVQPESDDYTYVLTCRHVLEVSEQDKTIKDKNSIDITFYNGLTLSNSHILDIYDDESNDIAILKIKKISSLNNNLIGCQENSDNETYTLIGYPECRRRDESDKFRPDKLEILNTTRDGKFIEAVIKNVSIKYSEIVGISGGGIISYKNNTSYILGIQAKIPVENEIESLNRVHFIPITNYQKVISTKGLAPIKILENIIESLSLDVSQFDLKDSLDDFERSLCRKGDFNYCFFYMEIKNITDISQHLLKRIEEQMNIENYTKTKEIVIHSHTQESDLTDDLNLILDSNEHNEKLIIPILVYSSFIEDFMNSFEVKLKTLNLDKKLIILIISSTQIKLEDIKFQIISIKSPNFEEFHLEQWFKKIFDLKNWKLEQNTKDKLKKISQLEYNTNKNILNIKKLYIFLNKTINSLKKSPQNLDQFILMLEGKKQNVNI